MEDAQRTLEQCVVKSVYTHARARTQGHATHTACQSQVILNHVCLLWSYAATAWPTGTSTSPTGQSRYTSTESCITSHSGLWYTGQCLSLVMLTYPPPCHMHKAHFAAHKTLPVVRSLVASSNASIYCQATAGIATHVPVCRRVLTHTHTHTALLRVCLLLLLQFLPLSRVGSFPRWSRALVTQCLSGGQERGRAAPEPCRVALQLLACGGGEVSQTHKPD